jgi:hypothetical protein
MTCNLGKIDRSARVILGLALVGLTIDGIIGPLGWIGVVPLVTGLIGWCPVYLPFGFRTCR